MSKENVTVSGGGLGFWSILQLIFITLKLCNVITWSWWAVLTPTWIGLGLLIIYVILAIILFNKLN